MLFKHLTANSVKCKLIWMRRPYFFTFPILLIARQLKLSSTIQIENGMSIGYHNFNESKIITNLYLSALLLDTAIYNLLLVRIPLFFLKITIVCDRYIPDIIVDSTISIGAEKLYQNRICEPLMKMMPRSCKTVILNSDINVLKSRRKDVEFDTTLNHKIDLYSDLVVKYSIITIDANLGVEEIHNKIIDLVMD